MAKAKKPKTSARKAATKKPAKTIKPAAKTAKKTAVKAKVAKPTVKKSTTRASALANKAKLNKPLLIVAGILIVGAGIIAANYNNASDPAPSNQAAYSEDAKAFSDEIIAHLRAGECQEIFAKTSDGFQAVITEENWLEQCGIASGVLTGTAEDVELADSNPEDEITEYSYAIDATDDQTYIVTTQLVNGDEVWQLQGINSDVETSGTEGDSETE